MFSFKETSESESESASAIFSAYASVAASTMLVRSMANELIPRELRAYLYSALRYLFNPLYSSSFTLVVDEYSGMPRNQLFDAADLYLRTKLSPSTSRLRVSKLPREKSIAVAIDKGEQVSDTFENIRLQWRLLHTENKNNHSGDEARYFELTFNKKFKDRVIEFYLPYVLFRAETIKQEDKVIKLYSRDCPYNEAEGGGGGGRGGRWGSINLEHPATFETLAMDPEMKRAIIEDLNQFVRRKDFYKKVGKAWKRGYLLYGPPGTGKSSLIAAMANYLKFDVYDLELTSVYSNGDLRRTLLSTSNRSILVVEDIDCSVNLQNRQYGEGLASSSTKLRRRANYCVVTTNHKDRLDPALLRPGRMDMHINMSYCTADGFRTLASNYLGIHGNDHHLCGEIEGLIDSTEVTPAEVAQELMKSENTDVVLEGLVNVLKRKKAETIERKEREVVKNDKGECQEQEAIDLPKLKRVKLNGHEACVGLSTIVRGRAVRGRSRRLF